MPQCTPAPPSSSAETSSPVAALTRGGPPQEYRAGPLHVHHVVAHGRDVGAARGTHPHDNSNLWNAEGRQARLVVEDPSEVLLVREDIGLHREERATRVQPALVGQVVLEVDPKNPQVAARLLSSLRAWRTLEPRRRALVEARLRDIVGRENLSADTRDIATRALA